MLPTSWDSMTCIIYYRSGFMHSCFCLCSSGILVSNCDLAEKLSTNISCYNLKAVRFKFRVKHLAFLQCSCKAHKSIDITIICFDIRSESIENKLRFIPRLQVQLQVEVTGNFTKFKAEVHLVEILVCTSAASVSCICVVGKLLNTVK